MPEASDLGGGWVTAIKVRTRFGDELLTRARVARNWIGTLGVEPMCIMAEVDADCGLTVVIQPDDPGPGVNWLPALADDGFYLTLRLYQPHRTHLEGAFVYPRVERLA